MTEDGYASLEDVWRLQGEGKHRRSLWGKVGFDFSQSSYTEQLCLLASCSCWQIHVRFPVRMRTGGASICEEKNVTEMNKVHMMKDVIQSRCTITLLVRNHDHTVLYATTLR